MRPGYFIVHHPTPNEERDGWVGLWKPKGHGYRIAVHGVEAPEFILHKSKIEECKTNEEYEELMCESADDLMRTHGIGT